MLNHILLRLDGLQQVIEQCLAKKKYRQVHTYIMLMLRLFTNNCVWRLVLLVSLLRLLKSLHRLLLFFLLLPATTLSLTATVDKANQSPIHLILQVKVTTHVLPITNITSKNDAHFILCNYTIVCFFSSS